MRSKTCRCLAALTVVIGWGLAATDAIAAEPVFEGPVPRAACGPGSEPEPSEIQGETPAADRQSGRSTKPYTCNLEQTGNDPGQGASWQHTWYENCAYYDTASKSALGTQVIDVSNPAKPRTATQLRSPAMLDPWETLSVTQSRGLLGGVYVANLQGASIFEVYDVKQDCKAPRLLFSGPVSGINHEGDWAADGKTYYATGIFGSGMVTAIDVTNPSAPRTLTAFQVSSSIHGLSTSADGKRLYVADIAGQGNGGNGLTIVDISEIQDRKPVPQVKVIGSVGWKDGRTAQHTVPVTIGGRPHVLFVDELGQGSARIIDISDEKKPRVISKLKLEIHMPANADRAAETGGDSIFGYNAHYCSVDRPVEPTIVVCSMFASGMRVFDIRDPLKPREIAYFNPGGTGKAPPPGSNFGFLTPAGNGPRSTSGYPAARPRIIEERGEIWFTDHNKGFFTARFTNGAWPFETGPAKDLGLPPFAGPPRPAAPGAPGAPAAPQRRCTSRRNFHIRLRAPRGKRLRSAVVYVNGKRVRVVRGKRLRARVDLRGLPKGRFRVRIVARTTKGKRITAERRYRTCTTKRRTGRRG